jgi:cell wall-associated NlpC family hydrolase
VMAYDPRLTPARPDLAAKHLEGTVNASRFVEGTPREVVDAQAPVRRAPSPEATMLTEALMGERITVYETTDEGWAWGQLADDGFVGWIAANALAVPRPSPTHKVSAPRTLLFPGPDIKLPPVAALPFGARLALVREHDPFVVTAFGYVPARHLEPIDAVEHDFVAVAERFVGVPYLWGGKTNLGVDCSGLVQLALTACGIPCPRDSDMQERALGSPLADPDPSDFRRGDLIFWEGHVAIVRGPDMLLHANAYHMAVVVEPLAPALERIRRAGSEVTGVKRL